MQLTEKAWCGIAVTSKIATGMSAFMAAYYFFTILLHDDHSAAAPLTAWAITAILMLYVVHPVVVARWERAFDRETERRAAESKARTIAYLKARG